MLFRVLSVQTLVLSVIKAGQDSLAWITQSFNARRGAKNINTGHKAAVSLCLHENFRAHIPSQPADKILHNFISVKKKKKGNPPVTRWKCKEPHDAVLSVNK